MRALLISILCFLAGGLIFGASVQGVVFDAYTGLPIPYANIQAKGTMAGALTNEGGAFVILCNTRDTLIVSCFGYDTREVDVSGRNDVSIELRTTIGQSKAVVSVGYGQEQKALVSGSISSIESRDVQNLPFSNVTMGFTGRAAGCYALTPSGVPDAAPMVMIRGNMNPLYVIDGIPMLSENNSELSLTFDLAGESTGPGQLISSIANINPNDIEKIEVLKDASAAAIYGARAANGVVLISTKRGKAGQNRVNFNYFTGMQSISRKIDFMGSQEFYRLVKEAQTNDRAKYEADPLYFGDGFDPTPLYEDLYNFKPEDGVNTDWLSSVIRQAPVSNYELSASGGNDKTTYFISGGYFDQEGIVIESSFKRAYYRMNLDHQVNRRFSIGANIYLSNSWMRRSFNDNTYSGVITNSIGAAPLMPVYEADGSYASYENYQASWLSDNPVKSAKEIRGKTRTLRGLATVFGAYKFTKQLGFRSSFSTDVTSLFDDLFKSPLTTDGAEAGGIKYESQFNQLTWLNENLLTYTKDFRKSTLSLLGGITVQNTQSQFMSQEGQGFPTGSLENISSAAIITGGKSTGSGFALVSYVSRINYNVEDKYIFNASLRADASSRFSQTNRTGFFPSAAFGWRLTNEPFMLSQTIFNELKFRASYGVTGDQEIGDFNNVSFYTPAGYNGQSGVMLRNLADPNLGWQKNTMFNTGFDFDFAGSRFSGSIDYFNGVKSDVLSDATVSGITGFSTVLRNGGEISNQGVELTLSYFPINNEKLRWNILGNITYLSNKVKSLANDDVLLPVFYDVGTTHILREGQPVGTFYGIKYTGVDPATGDAMYEDINGDGIIDSDDSQPIGQAIPKYYGGVANYFNFGSFDAGVLASFAWGHQVFNVIRSVYENLGYSNDGAGFSVFANNSTTVRDRWQQPGDVAEYPRATYTFSQLQQNSSFFVEDAANLRIQQVTLGYTFKNSKRLKGTRLYATINNAFIFTNYKGFDPEVSSNSTSQATSGVDFAAYPRARTFMIGINLAL